MNNLLLISLLGFAITIEAGKICKKYENWLINENKTDKTDRGMKLKSPRNIGENDNKSVYKYDKDLESLVNSQIQSEMHAFYSYLSMSRFFTRYDQNRPGFAKYFRDAATEELEHAESFMKYQQMRGGTVIFGVIPVPAESHWKNGKDVLKAAYDLEKSVTEEILCLHEFTVNKFGDTDLANYLEEKVISEQYQSLKEIKTHIKTLDRACATDNVACAQYPIYELRYDEVLLNGSK